MFGIVGYGVVGKATHKGILNNNKDVIVHDIKHGTSIEDLKYCQYVFFCIRTDNLDDINNLVNEISRLKEVNKNYTVIVRSTVPLGFGEYIEKQINEKILYIPEFLRDRCWEEDCLNRPLILGHNNLKLPKFLKEEQTIECSLADAELLKMFSNNFASLRITFANHMYDLSKAYDADYNKVIELYNEVKHDQSYLAVNNELRGFGGKCLPKDLDFVIDTFRQNNLDQSLFDSIKEDNSKWKITVRKS